MIAVHRLLDQEAIDEWLRSVQAQLTATSSRDDAPGVDCHWLLLRCADTLRYDLRYDCETKYESVVHLIEELEAAAAEFPAAVPADLTTRARDLVKDAERKRFRNG